MKKRGYSCKSHTQRYNRYWWHFFDTVVAVSEESLVLQWPQGQGLQASRLLFWADGSSTQHSAVHRKEQSRPIWPLFKIRCWEKSLRMEIQRLGSSPGHVTRLHAWLWAGFSSPLGLGFAICEWGCWLDTFPPSLSSKKFDVCGWGWGVQAVSCPWLPSRRAELTSLSDRKSQHPEEPFETNAGRCQGWDSFRSHVSLAEH